jgi:subtilisin family serine protease
MKCSLAVVASLISVGVSDASASAAAIPGQYVVVLKDSVSDPGAVAAAEGKAYGFKARFVYGHALKGYAASFSAATASALATNPSVAYIAPDESFEAAEGCAQISPASSQQCLPNWAHRIAAERSSTKSGDGKGSVNINVAVIDTGIDATHPDLNVVGGVNCANGQSFEDATGHGTLVAGILGAKDNSFGIVGVAPGAKLWSVRVLNNAGAGTTGGILCGIDWVTATRADSNRTNDIAVANMSVVSFSKNSGEDSQTPGEDGNCGYTIKDPVHQAICASTAAGVTYVVAAGNSAADFQVTLPAAYHEVLTATAIGDSDGLSGGSGGGFGPQSCLPGQSDDAYASFSNFATLPGDQAHTVAASGVCDLSTDPLANCATKENPHPSECLNVEFGTSFASPAVAGAVALCISDAVCAGLTPAQIVKKIVADAQAYNTANPGYGFVGDPLRPVEGKYFGYLIRAGLY